MKRVEQTQKQVLELKSEELATVLPLLLIWLCFHYGEGHT